MIIIPAIDIINGKPVRLYQGDYDQKEIVASNVEDLVKVFMTAKASYLHLVDLDGAKAGKPMNAGLIKKVARMASMPVEVGGGIRTIDDIKDYIDNGVSRVILGTSAIEDEKLLIKAIKIYGDKIAVGIDARAGKVYGRGWLDSSDIDFIEFAKKLETLGVTTIIVTDIDKDGTLKGPNIQMYEQLKEAVEINIIASGGIRNMEDIIELNRRDLYGAITGKAMYHNTLNIKEAIEYCEGTE